MTKRQAEVLVADALQAAEEIGSFIGNIDFNAFLSDSKTRRAVEREFTIIGEALAALARAAPDIAISIDDLPRIVGFRNVLIHGYAQIDHAKVWEITTLRLPALTEQLRVILARLDLG
jgi:uncharacterized protein with HEPN domain